MRVYYYNMNFEYTRNTQGLIYIIDNLLPIAATAKIKYLQLKNITLKFISHY